MKKAHILNLLLVLFAGVNLIGCGAGRERLEFAAGGAADEPKVKLGSVASKIGEPEQLTFGEGDNGIGSYHPDGDRVVFQSNRDGLWQIYELNLDTGLERRLIESLSNDENPRWTPDGFAVFFVSDRDGGGDEWERDIYLFDPIGDVTARLTKAKGDDWFPVPVDDDEYLFLSERGAGAETAVIARANRVYVGRVDGSEPRLSVDEQFDFSSPAVAGADDIIVRSSNGALYKFNRASKSKMRLTPSWLRCGNCDYASGRGWVAFTGEEGDSFGLYLLDPGKGRLEKLGTAATALRYPQFSPDARWLLYSAEVDGNYQLFRIKLD